MLSPGCPAKPGGAPKLGGSVAPQWGQWGGVGWLASSAEPQLVQACMEAKRRQGYHERVHGFDRPGGTGPVVITGVCRYDSPRDPS